LQKQLKTYEQKNITIHRNLNNRLKSTYRPKNEILSHTIFEGEKVDNVLGGVD